MSIINLQSRTPEHVFDIVLNIGDGSANEYNYKMRKLGEFNYGNDEDVDTILYPANVKIEFTFAASDIPLHFGGGTYGDFRNFEKEYFNLINKFSFLDTSVTINKDGVEYFNGFVDQKNKGGSFEEKTIEITALSDFSKLKDIDPRDLNYNDLETLPANPYGKTVLFTDAILETIRLAIPTFEEVILISDIQSETGYSYGGGTYKAPASTMGDFSKYFWGSLTGHDNCVDLIKDILNSLGSTGVVIGKKFYIQSRWNVSTETPITLKAREFIKDEGPLPNYSRRRDGLQLFVRNHVGEVWEEFIFGVVEKDVDGNVVDQEKIETLRISFPGGTSPELVTNNIWLRIPDTVSGIGDIWVVSIIDSFFTTALPDLSSLWLIIGNSIWNLVQFDRLIYQLEMKGTGWLYDKFYKFEYGLTETFRPRKLRYNYPNKSTVMDVIKC